MTGMQWLRFHAYGVGLPKTGTTSLSAMMANYRTGHEASLDWLSDAAVARVRNQIDDDSFWGFVRARFVPLRGEMDVVTCHHMYVDILQEKYPKAKFVVTYRDVRSWVNSLLGLVTIWRRTPLDRRRDRDWYRSYGDWISEGTFSIDPADPRDDTAALPALMRSWASYMHSMQALLPPERTIWIKTPELTLKLPELAEFLKIPVDSIIEEDVHRNKSSATLDRFTIAHRTEIDHVYTEYCARLMAEHFPQEHAHFLNRTTVAPEEVWREYVARVDAQFAS